MPPLPTSFSVEASQIISSLERHIKDVSDYQIPRLRDCKGPISVQQGLATELREYVDALSLQIETLSSLVLDQERESNRKALQVVADEYNQTLAKIRREYRSALVASKRAIDAHGVSNRAELLRTSRPTEKRDPNEKVTEDMLMKTNNDITETLRRTIGLMQNELERSVLSTQMLESSTATLQSTSATHDVLANFLGTSKQLVTALEKSDWLDRLVLLAAMLFFFVVCLFILKERILDRGLRVALFWTRFMPDFGSDEALLKMEEASKPLSSITSSTIASAAITASTVLSSVISSASSTSTSVYIGPTSDDADSVILSSVLEEVLTDASTTSIMNYAHGSKPSSVTTELTQPEQRPRDEL